MSITTAADWFTDEAEFRQLCGDAQSQSRTEKAQEFTSELVVEAKSEGLATKLTVGQLKWLCDLADWDMPKRIEKPAPAQESTRYTPRTWPTERNKLGGPCVHCSAGQAEHIGLTCAEVRKRREERLKERMEVVATSNAYARAPTPEGFLEEYEDWVQRKFFGPSEVDLKNLFVMTTGIGGETAEVQELLCNELAVIAHLSTSLGKSVGGVTEPIKKHIRDQRLIARPDMVKEIGDVLFYLTRIASWQGITMREVIEANQAKVNARWPHDAGQKP